MRARFVTDARSNYSHSMAEFSTAFNKLIMRVTGFGAAAPIARESKESSCVSIRPSDTRADDMLLEPLFVANRVVAIILPRQPFVEWINAADPTPSNANITLADTHEEPLVFLVPTDETDDLDHPGKRWIQRNWEVLFERMLEDIYTDPALWPRNRNLKMFCEWCEVRIHSLVLDCGDTELEYD